MEKNSDICLVIEGSYPYVTGGVSAWVQWLLENMKEYTFSIAALIAEPKDETDRRYRLPDNVVSYHEYVIFNYQEIESAKPLKISKRRWRRLAERLYRLMHDWQKGHLSAESLALLKEIMTDLSPRVFKNFTEDEAAFALLTRLYDDFRQDAGFVKYFYNFRNIHLILFNLLTMVPTLPNAAIYHAPSTGYGGMLACLRAAIWGGKSFITEHGIYVQEREMELLKAEWLDESYLKDMWIDFFYATCRWQYNICDCISTLFQGNKQLAVDYGAPQDKVRVIPNGINILRFKAARSTRCTRNPRIVGFVGRVDSVKDIKTLIQAMAIIRKGYSNVKGLIVGPTEEQPVYYQECQQLVSMLNLNETVAFTGRADVLKYYQKMDVMLLTSIKEAMPLVVLEAMASGIPVVATDVGACRELLLGTGDDLGSAGVVKRIKDADGIAEATLEILKNPELANTMGRNGIRRVEKLYQEQLVIDQYKGIYQELLNSGRN